MYGKLIFGDGVALDLFAKQVFLEERYNNFDGIELPNVNFTLAAKFNFGMLRKSV